MSRNIQPKSKSAFKEGIKKRKSQKGKAFENKTFEIRKVSQMRIRRNRPEFLVKWKNYGRKADSWEPLESFIHASETLIDFRKNFPEIPKQPPPKVDGQGNQRKIEEEKEENGDEDNKTRNRKRALTAPRRSTRNQTKKDNPDVEESEEEKKYEIQRITGMRFVDDQAEFYVQWKGYGSKNDSWEPVESFACDPETLRDFRDTFLAVQAPPVQENDEDSDAPEPAEAQEAGAKRTKLAPKPRDPKTPRKNDDLLTPRNRAQFVADDAAAPEETQQNVAAKTPKRGGKAEDGIIPRKIENIQLANGDATDQATMAQPGKTPVREPKPKNLFTQFRTPKAKVQLPTVAQETPKNTPTDAIQRRKRKWSFTDTNTDSDTDNTKEIIQQEKYKYQEDDVLEVNNGNDYVIQGDASNQLAFDSEDKHSDECGSDAAVEDTEMAENEELDADVPYMNDDPAEDSQEAYEDVSDVEYSEKESDDEYIDEYSDTDDDDDDGEMQLAEESDEEHREEVYQNNNDDDQVTENQEGKKEYAQFKHYVKEQEPQPPIEEIMKDLADWMSTKLLLKNELSRIAACPLAHEQCVFCGKHYASILCHDFPTYKRRKKFVDNHKGCKACGSSKHRKTKTPRCHDTHFTRITSKCDFCGKFGHHPEMCTVFDESEFVKKFPLLMHPKAPAEKKKPRRGRRNR